MLIIVVIVSLLLAIVATIVAIYAVIKDDNDQDEMSGNGSVAGVVSSACDQVECLHGGTCANQNPDSYVCSCVPPFYGRHCQYGR